MALRVIFPALILARAALCYQLENSPRKKAAGAGTRKDFISSIGFGLAGSFLATPPARAFNPFSELPTQTVDETAELAFKTVRGRTTEGDATFEIDVPSGWYLSQGGTRLNGVVLSVVDFKSGATISVVEATVSSLLEGDALKDFGGAVAEYRSFRDVGLKPLALADLLVQLRDGDLRSAGARRGSSFATAAEWTSPWSPSPSSSSDPETRLAFSVDTILSQGVSGAAGFNRCITGSSASKLGETEAGPNAFAPVCDGDSAVEKLRQAAAQNSSERRRSFRGEAWLLPPSKTVRLATTTTGGMVTDRHPKGRLLVLWCGFPEAPGPAAASFDAVQRRAFASFAPKPAV